MSFIGPRPLLLEYLKLYNKEQIKRHDVMPGFSGGHRLMDEIILIGIKDLN